MKFLKLWISSMVTVIQVGIFTALLFLPIGLVGTGHILHFGYLLLYIPILGLFVARAHHYIDQDIERILR